jgi:hypothetical protein
MKVVCDFSTKNILHKNHYKYIKIKQVIVLLIIYYSFTIILNIKKR